MELSFSVRQAVIMDIWEDYKKGNIVMVAPILFCHFWFKQQLYTKENFATKFECKFTIETGILSPELTKSFE